MKGSSKGAGVEVSSGKTGKRRNCKKVRDRPERSKGGVGVLIKITWRTKKTYGKTWVESRGPRLGQKRLNNPQGSQAARNEETGQKDFQGAGKSLNSLIDRLTPSGKQGTGWQEKKGRIGRGANSPIQK